MHPIPEQRQILRRVTSPLVDIVVAEKEPGYTSHRSTCPDGQFWLPLRGTQFVSGPRGNRKQETFELMYYAPREAAIRTTDTPTLAYGLRLMLSSLNEHERDDSWAQGRAMSWETKRMVVGLMLNALTGTADQYEMDEAVAQWIAKPQKAKDEICQTPWMAQVIDLLEDNPSLSLVELSRRVGVVPCYLSTQFNRIKGHTLSACRRRIMLNQTIQNAVGRTLNEAAIESGFYDASHFHRACLAELGAKPSDIRRLIWPT